MTTKATLARWPRGKGARLSRMLRPAFGPAQRADARGREAGAGASRSLTFLRCHMEHFVAFA
eukprot:766378-Pyramimonas_sp.AAC.2